MEKEISYCDNSNSLIDFCSLVDNLNQVTNSMNVNFSKKKFTRNTETASISSNSSISNLKIDAPEFIPKREEFKCSDVNPLEITNPVLRSNNYSETNLSDVISLLQTIKEQLSHGFSKINHQQIEFLFKNEDRICFLQKMFLEEINNDKKRIEEEKIKNFQLEAKIQNLNEILDKTIKEKEEHIANMVLLKTRFEKYATSMNDFQKKVLNGSKIKCSIVKAKMNQLLPYITNYSVPCYDHFYKNLQDWNSYETCIQRNSVILNNTSKLVNKNVDFLDFDNLIQDDEFPFVEPRCILIDAFQLSNPSYMFLPQTRNTPQLHQQQYTQENNDLLQYQQHRACNNPPIYYPEQKEQDNINKNPQQHLKAISHKTDLEQSETISEMKTNVEDEVSLEKPNEEHQDDPSELNLTKIVQDLTNKLNIDSNDANSLHGKIKPFKIKSVKGNIHRTKKNPANSQECDKADTTGLETSIVSHESSIEKKNENSPKIYNSSLSIEEQIENLSADVKAAGGIKFLHLFIYLWQNLPNVTEEALLKAILNVKKSVGKFSGMKKESILISVKRILDREKDSLSHSMENKNMCTICYEDLSTEKVMLLECGHLFHHLCAAKWLVNNSICPICRSFILCEDLL